jgi:acetaldehyde dehydrogenase
VQAYAVGYQMTVCVVTEDRAFITVEVTPGGDGIPQYAGNLDIINSAAVHVAERRSAVGLEPIGMGKS